MEPIRIIAASKDRKTCNAVFKLLKQKYHLFIVKPDIFDDLLKKPFPGASFALIDSEFSDDRGLDALKALKDFYPSLPVIFMTSKGTEELCMNAFKIGARDYFKKPYNFIDVIQSIELVLKSKKEGKRSRTNIFSGNHSAKQLPSNVPLSVDKAIRYMEENFNKTFSLDLLSKFVCSSKFHFCRTFKKETGMSCIEYLNEVRVKKAEEFLRNRFLTLSDICFLTGFNDLTYFGRVFKKETGKSPSVYRNKF